MTIPTPQSRPPGYELFFTPLQVMLDPTTYERVQFAYFASKYGHAVQVRDDGTRYFDHPKAAAWIYIDEFNGRDAELIINILLHDLSEDTYLLSPYRIALNFGTERALDVRALTKLPKGKETTEEYLRRLIARGPRTVFAKLCDRLHNLRTLDSTTPEKRERTISETLNYHVPTLLGALVSWGAPWDEMSRKMEAKVMSAIEEYQAAKN